MPITHDVTLFHLAKKTIRTSTNQWLNAGSEIYCAVQLIMIIIIKDLLSVWLHLVLLVKLWHTPHNKTVGNVGTISICLV